ncbi:DUF1016 domain-containing protein [Hymenobacter setariae]|uniref:DUF1016 domain-containing protein n=1 Tax=Hymenobacter setariae TaxID=2594794 RepID=A0A558BK92_9BACT|nr:DUF1016 domain-containing protein [Hymenobacter setariae]
MKAEYGRSYAKKSLRRMMQFAVVLAESVIVATLWRQLSWSHFKLLMAVTEPLKRDFYTQLATLHHCSVRELTKQQTRSFTSAQLSAVSPRRLLLRN